jgi:hypothetical protein
MANPILPTDARRLRSELAADDRAWRLGYEAGKRDRWWRRAPEAAFIAAAFGSLVALWVLALRRRASAWLLVGAVLATALAVAVGLVAVPTLAAVSIVRQHRRWHSWRRTGLLAGSWLAGFGALALAYLTIDSWPLIVPAVLLVAWQVETRAGHQQSLRYRPPTDEPPFSDADRMLGHRSPAESKHGSSSRCSAIGKAS